MRLPWRVRGEAAEQAAQDARGDLADARQQRREVERLVGIARLFRERNHFAEAIETLLRERR